MRDNKFSTRSIKVVSLRACLVLLMMFLILLNSQTASASTNQVRGKQPKLSAKQEAHLVGLYQAGGHTSAELFGVAHSTVYRAVERDRETIS